MGADARATWTIAAVDTGTSSLDKSMLTYCYGAGEIAVIPRIMWVLRGPTVVVVDTSVPTGARASEFIGEELSRTKDQEPANALSLAGVDPRDVETILLTHLHWDHAGNNDLFPEARVLVQRDELRYAIAPGPFFRKAFLAPESGWGVPPYLGPRIATIEGATEIHPGLRVIPVPGHTPGSQAIAVDTEHGTFCIGGDAIMTYDNIERNLPPGFHVNVDDAVSSLDRMRAESDHLLPSHDYGVLLDGNVTAIDARHTTSGRAAWRPGPGSG